MRDERKTLILNVYQISKNKTRDVENRNEDIKNRKREKHDVRSNKEN